MNSLNHVAFIMDGNGRWGKKEEVKLWTHKRSRNIKKIVKSAIKFKIPIVTFYVFLLKIGSVQKRGSFLFKLIKSYFSKEIENVKNQGIKLNILEMKN